MTKHTPLFRKIVALCAFDVLRAVRITKLPKGPWDTKNTIPSKFTKCSKFTRNSESLSPKEPSGNSFFHFSGVFWKAKKLLQCRESLGIVKILHASDSLPQKVGIVFLVSQGPLGALQNRHHLHEGYRRYPP